MNGRTFALALLCLERGAILQEARKLRPRPPSRPSASR